MVLCLPSSLPLGIYAILYALSYFNIMITSIAAVYNEVNESYDFIIVGAGSSGAVTASRLSEKPYNYKVLLAEAGGQENPISQIPLISTELQLTYMNWHFRSEPQEYACLGLKEKRGNIPCGKSLGGSSAINAMFYVRGNRRDYDRWASLGNYGWSWKEVLPYFLKSEDNHSPNMTNDVNHGKGGLLSVSDVSYHTDLLNAYHKAVESMGYPIRDINGEFQSGAMPVQATILKGRRFSTNKAFIKPASKRPNLHIKTHAMALRVLFDEDKRATGVEYEQKGKKYVAKALKEVILSAGAINTPKLLLLSGIGAKEHLDQLNISTVVNLPGVGQNLQDHVIVTGLTFTVTTNVPITLIKGLLPTNLLRYALFGTGPLASPTGSESLSFFKTRFANQSDDWPDIHQLLLAISPLTDFGLLSRHVIGYTDETWNQYYGPHIGKKSFSIYPSIMRPKSCGFVKLRSKNPNDHPIIDPKYLSHPDDVRVLVEGIKIALNLGNSASFKKYGTKLIDGVVPGCKKHQRYSYDYWTCFARHMSFSAYHPVGTAKMGRNTDPMAVVDPELRVYGVKGLRIVDCSIMPEIISGNTNAPAIMIGEKASDMIKKMHCKSK